MIAIIGGSGFIGSRLCRRLSDSNTEFFIVDIVKSPWFPDRTRIADVRDAAALTAVLEGADTVINLAAEHRDDVRPISKYYEVNVNGAENIVAAAEALGILRIIFTSTVAVYGFVTEETDEKGAIAPFNHYGKSKYKAEEVFGAWSEKAKGRALTIVRPTVVFGERNRGNVYNLLNQMASGRFAMVGSGRNIKSMAYVENIAAFLEFAAGNPECVGVYNFADKPDMDMNSLVALVRTAFGKPSNSFIRVPYWIGYAGGLAFDALAAITRRRFAISSVRVRKFNATTRFASSNPVPGFTVPVTLEEGLRRTIKFEFLNNNRDDLIFESE